MKQLGTVAAMVLGLVMLLGMGITEGAEQDYCWVLAPFEDDLRITINQPDPKIGLYFIKNVVWNGLHVYQLHGGGTANLIPVMAPNSQGRYSVVPGQSRIEMKVDVQNLTEFFGGNRYGHLYASIGTVTFTGPWHITFLGDGTNNGVFQQQGNIVPRDCGSQNMAMMSMSSEASGGLAGE